MDHLKGIATNEGTALGVRTSITNYADAAEGVSGFQVNLLGANLNLAKGVHAAIQDEAIRTNTPIETRLYPGRILVYQKTIARTTTKGD